MIDDVITHMISEVAEELASSSMTNGSQHSRQLHEKKAMPPPKLPTQIVLQGKTVLIHIKLKKWTN